MSWSRIKPGDNLELGLSEEVSKHYVHVNNQTSGSNFLLANSQGMTYFMNR